MARYKCQGVSIDQVGNVIPSATIAVTLTGASTAASIYTTSTGTTAVNSVTSDSNGLWSFYVDNLDYDYEQAFDVGISKADSYGMSYTTQTYTNIGMASLSLVTGTYTISSAKTPSTHIVAKKGVVYTKSDSGTMAFSGIFEAGPWQCFGSFSAGNVTFPTGQVVRPEWWGAAANGATDDATAISCAAASLPYGGTVLFRGKTYLVASTITVSYGYVKLQGELMGWTGQYGTIITANFTNADIIRVWGADTDNKIYHNEINDMVITRTHAAAATGTNLSLKWTVRTSVHRVVSAEGNYGFSIYNCTDPFLDQCWSGRNSDFSANSYAYYLDGDSINASITLRNCSAFFPAGAHTADGYGIYSSGDSIGDIWILNPNLGSCEYGIYLDADSTTYFDIQISNPVVDSCIKRGIYLEGFGTDGSVTITGGWLSGYDTNVAKGGIQVYNCAGGVHVFGTQIYGSADKAYYTGVLVNGTSLLNDFIGLNIKQCVVGYNFDTGAVSNRVLGGELANCTTNVTNTSATNLFYGVGGYLTEAHGETSALASGAIVTHGLGSTPTSVILQTKDGSPTAIYPSDLGATTFAVNYTGGGTEVFYWYAKV